MSVDLVIVSQRARLDEGVVELAGQMSHGRVRLVAAGGTEDGMLGTSLAKVLGAIEIADAADGVAVLVDLGSAGLVAEMALEQLPERRRGHVRLFVAPLVEGAVGAAIEASACSTLDQVVAAAQDAAHLKTIARRT